MLRAPLADRLVWARVTRPPVPLVYLDLNHYINLAKANMAASDPSKASKVLAGYPELLEAARKANADGRAIFPLSIVHMLEMALRVPSPRQRADVADVADVMEELSGFTYLMGRPTLALLEIDAGLDLVYGTPENPDAYLPLLGSSFGWAFGRVVKLRITDRIGADNTARVRQRMGEAAYAAFIARADYIRERKMLEGPVDSDLSALHKYGYDPEQTRKSTLSRLGFEQDTAWVLAADPQWRTNGRLRDVISARDVFHEWIDIFVRHQQVRERAGLPHDLLEADHMAGFWAAMPQVQVAISIKTRYHRNPRRTWKSNDIADIDAMSIAYPYCDAVLTDQEARAAMKDSPDRRPIGTYLSKGPLELADWLNALPVVANADQQVQHPLTLGS